MKTAELVLTQNVWTCLVECEKDLDAELEVEEERAQVMKTVFPEKADFEAGDRKR